MDVVNLSVDWSCKCFGYRCFKNAVKQLHLRNPHLETTSIFPNKFIFGDVISDHNLGTDPPEEDIPPPSPTFGIALYESDED